MWYSRQFGYKGHLESYSCACLMLMQGKLTNQKQKYETECPEYYYKKIKKSVLNIVTVEPCYNKAHYKEIFDITKNRCSP